MGSSFQYSSDNKRYYTQNYFLFRKFGRKVIKLSVNAGMTCPNRDGTKGVGGCTYCSDSLSGDFAGNPDLSITTQLEQQRQKLASKWGEGLYIPYFQAGSNTYAPLDKLKQLFEEALAFENTVGLAVATRADCISQETAQYMGKLSKRTYFTAELGLQSIFDATAEHINRCHTYGEFLDCYEMLTDYGVNVCIHIINGLPGETPEMMLETARELARLKPHSVKIHMLHVIKGTKMARENPPLMSLEDYTQIVCNQLEVLPQETIIQRVTGDGDKSALSAPLWTLKKFVVMNEIDKELVRRNSWQGKRYTT